MRGRSKAAALFTAALMPLVAFVPGSTAQASPAPLSVSPVSASAAPAAPAAAYGVRITLRASASSVVSGSKVTLRGKAYGTRAGTKMVIYRKMSGSKKWVNVGHGRLNRTGRFNYSETVTGGSRQYGACALRKCSPAVSVTMISPVPVPTVPPAPTTPAPKPTPTPTTKPTPAPKVQPTLTVATASPPSLAAGEKITVTGTSTNLAGQVVHLQSLDAAGKVWGDVGTATVNSDGSWSVVGTLTRSGKSIPLQVTVAESATTLAVTTAITPVTVYGWTYIYDYASQQVAGSSYEYSYPVNGVTYSKSIGMTSSQGYTSYVEYNLGRSCTRFEATIGINDQANPSTMRVQTRIMTDSVQAYTKADIGLGQAYPISLDITNALRLRLEDTETVGGDGYLVFGDARILCAF